MTDTLNTHNQQEESTFAAGCFWCYEPIFSQLQGVQEVTVGYTGGSVENPTYEQHGEGEDAHAEAFHIVFDPSIISYEQLLDIFFTVHDPTTYHRQGNDIGPEYRSAIFYHSDVQRDLAMKKIRELTDATAFDNPIVTEVVKASQFYPAEEYHQQFYDRNQRQPYCQAVILPKIGKFREKFAGLLM